MISKLVVLNLYYEVMLKFKWCNSVYNHTHTCFWSDQPQHWSDHLTNGGWRSRKWRGWNINQSMISEPVAGNLSYELKLKFEWCSTSLYPYTHMFWARPATKLVGLHQNRDWLGRKWRGLSRNQSMISEPVVVNL